ncbi:uncharacterized protein LOC131208197 [Anopheles bellator]|uniref:uncharacterized protein LOC131208197 n=1 Tax=Anopheles bellator TaxID=139047 RepID=UPI002646FDFA|nr:uncharacterized protein LOC131208197 [Anopheles bellator]
MFSCCRCVNPKSPKQKEKLAAGKGDKNAESESESEEQHTKQPKSNEAPPATVSHLPTVDNLSQDDEEIKIEIIENSDNPPSSSGGSAATTAALNGGRSPAEPTSEGAPAGTQSPLDKRHPAETEPAAPGPNDTERAASLNLDAASASSSSPASKTPSNLASGQSSSAVVTEIEAQPLAHNESTDADSTGDATNTPQEIPTTVGELLAAEEKQKLPDPPGPERADSADSKAHNDVPPKESSDECRSHEDNANGTQGRRPHPEHQEDDETPVDDAAGRAFISDAPEGRRSDEQLLPGATGPDPIDDSLEGEETAEPPLPPPPPPVDSLAAPPEDEPEPMADGKEQQRDCCGAKMERLQSEPSNSEDTIEETIDVEKYLLPQRRSDRGAESDDENPLSSSSDGSAVASGDDGAISDNESSPSSEKKGCGETETTRAPVAALSPSNEAQVSSKHSSGGEHDDTSTLSESAPRTAPTNGDSPSGIEADNSSSRKESVNSDDTTIRTQVSFRESCLSRRSSSKSSVKKKVAYNESTEVIPPPEYPPPEDDDSVFSDSIPPRLPRGDMCTPYATKRGSLPGMIALPDWFAEDRLMMEEGGIMEPPTTPIGRDELALRRHRFFSELLNAAHAAVEHRVRFDPLGPEIAKVQTEETEESEDCDPDLKPSSARELECLIDRLERIVDRLERTVSARELEETRRILKDACVVGKAAIQSNDGRANTVTRRAVVNRHAFLTKEPSEQRDLPTVLPSTPPPSASFLHQQIDSLESSLFPEFTDRLQAHGSSSATATELSTVIHTHSSAFLNHTNPLTAQEQRDNAVLSFATQNSAVVVPADPVPRTMSINAYEDIMLGSFASFLTLANKIGGDVATQAQFVKEAFDVQLAFLKVAAASSAPSSNADLQSLLKPTSDKIATIQSFREKNRTSPFFNHLSAISESIPALGWVCVAPTPGPYVKEMNDAGQFYTNRVLKDWKEKDATHVEWARAWIQTLTELQQFIKQHHTTGLVWSGKDKPVVGGSAVPPPPPPGGLPPPPPMMPLGDMSAGGVGDDRSALFAQINQGADITKGLKKVTSEMQTHKNPGLRTGPAPYKAPTAVTNGTKSVAAPATAKAPSFMRDGKKWLIEYQKNNADLLVENAEMNNVVYMFRCEGSTLQIKGKINSVVMDSCKKCSLVFDTMVSSAEFVNCQSVQMQVLGKVPTISVDKTDGCQMYLSADSLDVEIVSSKSSEMNVMIPKGSTGDYVEQPIPEQFKTVVKGTSLNTTCVESLG